MKTAFRISLDGAQAVPGITTSASGFGYAVFDDVAITLSYSITVAGLDFGTVLDGGSSETPTTDDDVTAAHFHIADRGASGGAAFNLFTQDADDFTQVHNSDGTRTISGTWEVSDPATNPITDFLATFAAVGDLGATGTHNPGHDIGVYVNIHTNGYPSGEIRGQLLAIADDAANNLEGGSGNDVLLGLGGADRLIGNGGNDTLNGGDGADTLNGGDGDDFIFGGETEADLRDVVYAGAGNDSIDAGYGNDLVYGMDGNDTILGGFGADSLLGQNGDDVITGGALSDLVFGGAANDFVNGGFGHDRINGGTGADKFYHLGIFDHGSDWIQDYNAAEGDVLLFGDPGAIADDFQVNFAHTANDAGERSGDDDVAEAFVIYKPTGQIVWALVDGAGQDEINLKVGGDVFDLLA